MIPASEITVVRFHAHGTCKKQVLDPFGAIISRQMVPTPTLRLPPASKGFTLPKIEIHRVAALKPAVIIVNSAVTIDLEHLILVAIFREERLNFHRRISP